MEVLYTSPKGGGTVLRTYSKASKEQVDNLAAAKIMADRKGYRVELLGINNTQGAKSADALINGKIWEIKTNKTPTYNAISNRLSDAKKQSPNVIIHITSDIPENDWKRAVYNRTMYKNPKSRSFELQNITTITKDEQVLEYNRDDIEKWRTELNKKGRFN